MESIPQTKIQKEHLNLSDDIDTDENIEANSSCSEYIPDTSTESLNSESGSDETSAIELERACVEKLVSMDMNTLNSNLLFYRLEISCHVY